MIYRLDVEVTSTDTSAHQVLAQMTEIIKTYSERLPLYLYLTAFSQIVSRICHPVKEVKTFGNCVKTERSIRQITEIINY